MSLVPDAFLVLQLDGLVGNATVATRRRVVVFETIARLRLEGRAVGTLARVAFDGAGCALASAHEIVLVLVQWRCSLVDHHVVIGRGWGLPWVLEVRCRWLVELGTGQRRCQIRLDSG